MLSSRINDEKAKLESPNSCSTVVVVLTLAPLCCVLVSYNLITSYRIHVPSAYRQTMAWQTIESSAEGRAEAVSSAEHHCQRLKKINAEHSVYSPLYICKQAEHGERDYGQNWVRSRIRKYFGREHRRVITIRVTTYTATRNTF